MPLYVTADWSRFVREDDPEARFVVAPVDVDRLGLGDALAAFLEPPAPPKEYPKPSDKAARRPSTK
jgi:hypothetical protein